MRIDLTVKDTPESRGLHLEIDSGIPDRDLSVASDYSGGPQYLVFELAEARPMYEKQTWGHPMPHDERRATVKLYACDLERIMEAARLHDLINWVPVDELAKVRSAAALALKRIDAIAGSADGHSA